MINVDVEMSLFLQREMSMDYGMCNFRAIMTKLSLLNRIVIRRNDAENDGKFADTFYWLSYSVFTTLRFFLVLQFLLLSDEKRHKASVSSPTAHVNNLQLLHCTFLF